MMQVPHEECEHESDNHTYTDYPFGLQNIKFKCKLCGEFYR